MSRGGRSGDDHALLRMDRLPFISNIPGHSFHAYAKLMAMAEIYRWDRVKRIVKTYMQMNPSINAKRVEQMIEFQKAEILRTQDPDKAYNIYRRPAGQPPAGHGENGHGDNGDGGDSGAAARVRRREKPPVRGLGDD